MSPTKAGDGPEEDSRDSWDALTDGEKAEYIARLERLGLSVESVGEAKRYWTQPNNVVADIYRTNAMPNHDPEHDTHYGYLGGETKEEDRQIELYGVGEFHPEVAGAGTPVFEATVVETDSYLTFCLPPDSLAEEFIRVFHTISYESGDFAELMNRTLRHFQGTNPDPRRVVFTNVVSRYLSGRDLSNVLDGFETRLVETDRGDLRELTGTWDPSRT